ncbi:MAG: glycoside hydrolase family 97 protein [Verrucomicrobiales bacterium]|nr:glycoside hydrolase family 97 protein [Verrucomicrobiales bacterium]
MKSEISPTLLTTVITGGWVLAAATPTALAQTQTWSVFSPMGHTQLTLRLADPGEATGQPTGLDRLYFRVEHGPDDHRATVIKESPLGLLLTGENLLDGLRFSRAGMPAVVTERYTMPHGKRRNCSNYANRLEVSFVSQGGLELVVELRAAADGVALRYRVNGDLDAPVQLESESTGFALPGDARLWLAPSDTPTTYAPAYETYYENEIPVGTPSPTGRGWSFPVLFRTADSAHWGLITEANLDRNSFGARLAGEPTDGVYRIRFPEPEEGLGTGDLKPTFRLPWTSPWRVILLGDTPEDIVESTLVNDLSEPSRVADTSWIKPGRVAWSWWSDQPSPRDGAKQKQFVDLAAEMGWEYILVDANWTIMDNGNIHDVIRYAKEKGVGVLLWYNSGGPHNEVTEKPRGTMANRATRRFEFDLLKQWGVKGVKVDFFQSDKQNVIQLYQDILQDAADFGIMVNFHGCTLPRGWSRTWPHLMSMEAVRGEECYIFDPAFPERAPVQNVITPFTRNVVGPMDYTPAGLQDNNHPRLTTTAHELALPVVFESGWTHFADGAAAYRALPDDVKDYLRRVPAAWDLTRCLSGYPGRHLVIARRSGNDWYVAGLNGGTAPLEVEIDLGVLRLKQAANAWLMTDGTEQHALNTRTQRVQPQDKLPVRLLPRGGFVLRLSSTN